MEYEVNVQGARPRQFEATTVASIHKTVLNQIELINRHASLSLLHPKCFQCKCVPGLWIRLHQQIAPQMAQPHKATEPPVQDETSQQDKGAFITHRFTYLCQVVLDRDASLGFAAKIRLKINHRRINSSNHLCSREWSSYWLVADFEERRRAPAANACETSLLKAAAIAWWMLLMRLRGVFQSTLLLTLPVVALVSLVLASLVLKLQQTRNPA